MTSKIDKYLLYWENMVEKTSSKIVNFLPIVLFAIIIFFIGKWLITMVMKLLKRTLTKYDIDPSLATFLKSLIKFSLHALLIISIIAILGFPTTSFIAILSAAGLAIGLALQGSLANFAGGVLILFFKPFKVGDYILSNGNKGVVKKIDILHTTILTYDNKVIIMPNGLLANNNITNYTKEKIRRMDIHIAIAYDTDIAFARKVILNIINKDPRIHKNPQPIVVLDKLGDFSLNLIVRWWTNTDICWEVYWDNLEGIKIELDNKGVKIPFPQKDINIKYQPDTNPNV